MSKQPGQRPHHMFTDAVGGQTGVAVNLVILVVPPPRRHDERRVADDLVERLALDGREEIALEEPDARCGAALLDIAAGNRECLRRWDNAGRPTLLRLTITHVPPAASTASWCRSMASISSVMLNAIITLRPVRSR